MKINISSKNIKNGNLAGLIPEFYELKKVIENNAWHNKEAVFDHTLCVLDSLKKIICGLSNQNKQRLGKLVGKNPREELLYFATLLHDIGKKETATDLGKGLCGCPGHEKRGAPKAEKILKRLDFSKKDSEFITSIVKNHGEIHYLIGRGLKGEDKNFGKRYNNFKIKFSKIYLELILLGFADTSGSYLKKTNPAEFRFRINFYKREIASYGI
jgi:hypothetical protein